MWPFGSTAFRVANGLGRTRRNSAVPATSFTFFSMSADGAADFSPAWIVVRGTDVPERWTDRAVPAFVIPLVASELEQMLGSGRAEPHLPADEERIARLLADDLPQTHIAATLGMSLRTVQRRVGLLRGKDRALREHTPAGSLSRGDHVVQL